jgi:uncharacterized protein (TIGR00730 family)
MTKSVCVFCGSASGVNEEHLSTAAALGSLLARQDIQVIYGGARVGMMGAVANAALTQGGRVIGVMPRGLERYEVAHRGLSELVWAADLHERKKQMAERSEAFIVLPGGFGTLEEALEVISWKQLHFMDKPIVLLDIRGFFQPLVSMAEMVSREGFAHASLDSLFTVVSRLEDVLPALGLGAGR